jgi:hyperosmotically inducible protein
MQKAMRTGVHGHGSSLILAVGLVCVFGTGSVAVAATDKEITEKVKSAIAADPVLSQRNIAVSTYKGRVLLQGEVPHEREADKAIGLANSVEDVRSVQNNFVGYLPHVTDTTARDKDISEKVKGALASDPMVGQRDIKVSTYKGRVQLLGNVPTQREADRAVELAKNVEETLSVQNDLLGYLPPLAFGTAGDKNATEKVKNAIAADAVLSQRKITVNTLEGRVFLTGNVDAQREAEKAVDLAKNVEEVRSVQDDLTGYLSP